MTMPQMAVHYLKFKDNASRQATAFFFPVLTSLCSCPALIVHHVRGCHAQ